MFLSVLCFQKAGILYRKRTTTGTNSAAPLALLGHFWLPSRTQVPGCLFAWVLENESQHFGVLFVLCWSLLSSVLSSTSLSRAPAKGGGRAVPACHQVPKPRQVKLCECHRSDWSKQVRDSSKTTTGLHFWHFSLPLDSSVKLLIWKESKKLRWKPSAVCYLLTYNQ